MANFSVENFRSEVLRTGLAKPNRFEVVIAGSRLDAEEARITSLFCEAASFPPMNIQTKPFKIQGPARQIPVNVEHGGEGISMSFIVDREMKIKKYFDTWMHDITSRAYFELEFKERYAKQITLIQLDEKDNPTYNVYLKDAFPRSMNIMELNHGTVNQFHRLNIIFAYRYWETDDIKHDIASGFRLEAVRNNFVSFLDINPI